MKKAISKLVLTTMIATSITGTTFAAELSNNTQEIDNNDASSSSVELSSNGESGITLDVDKEEASSESFSLEGVVEGIKEDKEVFVVATGRFTTKRSKVSADGSYSISNLPIGKYTVKIDALGYYSANSRTIDSEGEDYTVDFELSKYDVDKYAYDWQYDGSIGGYETTSNIVEPVKPVLGDKIIDQSQVGASYKLEKEYRIILSDDGETWSNEYAAALLKTMKTIPQSTSKKTVWTLEDKELNNDIDIERDGDIYRIVVSVKAFENATPRHAEIDGVKGKYFSKRLHNAIIRFATDNGRNKSAIKKILKERFNVSIYNVPYKSITKNTTGEDKNRFQNFKPEEVITLISALEEMPSGFHKAGDLKYIIRRKDGLNHPLYDTAPAVAWPKSGYIEFMESAFKKQDSSYMLKLVIHEKTHFLYENLFDEKLREDWIELGGWFKNDNDSDGWSTTKTTSFVSNYAHAHNPSEDMSETISYYVYNPNKLKSVAPEKYEFVRDRIMHGDMYIASIREDLQFKVYNLAPDYEYPGKISNVHIEVNGKGSDEKKAKIRIKLDTKGIDNRKAKYAYMRVFSPIGTFTDLYLMPTNGRQSDVLEGTLDIPSSAKAGYWHVEEIVVADSAGNERFEGIEDFGWKLYINNDTEDTTAPKYVSQSLEYKLKEETVEGKKAQVLTVLWDFEEENDMDYVFARLRVPNSDKYTLDEYGKVNGDGRAEVKFIIPDYFPSGDYSVAFVSMGDKALNKGKQGFSTYKKDEAPKYIEILTTNPDNSAPEMDLNNIKVEAEPTNPSKPNGETLVTIKVMIRDDNSGLGTASYRLLSPSGKSYFDYMYHDNTHTTFYKGDATEWSEYTIKHLLPVGSEPGVWGVEVMTLYDKAGNRVDHDFKEIIHFEVNK